MEGEQDCIIPAIPSAHTNHDDVNVKEHFVCGLEAMEMDQSSTTRDGSLNWQGKPALKGDTGGWKCGILLLVNQGLCSLAFTGVEVNLVLFSKSVLRQTNAEAANTFSRWMGTTYLFSLMGAFISDSYLGKYLTCVAFQVIIVVGAGLLSFITQTSLLKPHGCGRIGVLCDPHSPVAVAVFYLSIYLVALGNGAPEPALAAFGADQFDEEDPKENQAKTSFYSYFYVALNLGSLIAETVLVYMENQGHWLLAFRICAASAMVAYLLLLGGTTRYRHFRPSGNPISRFSQVIVASFKKIKLQLPQDGERLYEGQAQQGGTNGTRRILRTNDFKFLDRAAIITPTDLSPMEDEDQLPNPWRLCPINQVEEVKCILRILPIWLCTILSSVVFIQMMSLFVEQGAAMNTAVSKFHIPPASMTVFDIVSTSAFILLYDKLILPLFIRITKREPNLPSKLQRIGIGLAIATVAIVIAGFVEQKRLKFASDTGKETSSLSILWQTPQYVLVGVAEAFVYVAQMEFFSSQSPDGFKSLAIALSMANTAIGSYVCSLFLTVVVKITSQNGKPGWIPPNLNHGHLDRFFFLSAGLTAVNLGIYILCAKRYKSISLEKRDEEEMK